MPISSFAYSLIFLLLFSCIQEKSDASITKQNTKPSDSIQFNLIFKDSIAYGCRGMELYDNEVYFSGIKGTCFKITEDFKVQLFVQKEDDSLDFRDILVVAKDEFYTINSGSDKGFIFHYLNGNIDTSYIAKHKGAFLDDLDKDSHGNIYCLGDPMPEDRSLFLVMTKDGQQWERIYKYAILGEDEFFFAASGSCMDIFKDTIYLAIGGKQSYIMRLLNDHPGIIIEESKIQAGESSGINAMFVEDGSIYAVGGDYRIPNDSSITFQKFSYDGLTSITGGYQSTITKEKDVLVCSGRNGTYYSNDDGKTWTRFLRDEFYKVILKNNKLYCSGPKGNIQIFEMKHGEN